MTTINIRNEVEALLGRSMNAIEDACFRDNRACGMANPHDLVGAIADFTKITKAIHDNEDFVAVKLILIQQGKAKSETAAFTAWTLGPHKGQELVADWIIKNEVFG